MIRSNGNRLTARSAFALLAVVVAVCGLSLPRAVGSGDPQPTSPPRPTPVPTVPPTPTPAVTINVSMEEEAGMRTIWAKPHGSATGFRANVTTSDGRDVTSQAVISWKVLVVGYSNGSRKWVTTSVGTGTRADIPFNVSTDNVPVSGSLNTYTDRQHQCRVIATATWQGITAQAEDRLFVDIGGVTTKAAGNRFPVGGPRYRNTSGAIRARSHVTRASPNGVVDHPTMSWKRGVNHAVHIQVSGQAEWEAKWEFICKAGQKITVGAELGWEGTWTEDFEDSVTVDVPALPDRDTLTVILLTDTAADQDYALPEVWTYSSGVKIVWISGMATKTTPGIASEMRTETYDPAVATQPF